MNPIRKAHGNGAKAVLRTELPPIDEFGCANAGDTARGMAVYAARGRPFEPGNEAASNRPPKLARIAPAEPTAHPLWRSKYRHQASRYARRRVAELAIMFGGKVSVAVQRLVGLAAKQAAASDLLYELAMTELDTTTIMQAAKLADMSRQAELTAIGLARLEQDSFQEDDDARNRRMRIAAQREREARRAAGATIDVTLVTEEKK